MYKLWSYTRNPIDNVYYDPRLAFSMHLALEEDGKLIELNHNSGVLFGKATQNEDGSLNPKAINYPCIFAIENGYEILAVRTLPEGEMDDEADGKVCRFITKDFVKYEDMGLVTVPDYYAKKLAELKNSFLNNEVSSELPVGANLCSSVSISNETAARIKQMLITPSHVATIFPEKITAGNAHELNTVQARRVFSDGTERKVPVIWNLSNVDWSKPGEVEICGRLKNDHYDFPIAYDRADPCMGKWGDKYYFIATNDADNNHTLYIREADSIPELVHAEEHLILDSKTHKGIGNLLWAPEFHVIGGKLCILHAATPDPFFEEESHVMVLKDGGNPCVMEDWDAPRKIVKADGSDICEAGKVITLDMTHFVWGDEDYVIWSERQFIPKDLGAWLYIAKLNPNEPWKLASEPVVLTKPEYAWENNHTFVVEGPYALISKKTLFITYSGAAVDTSYVVGLLSIKAGLDPLDASNWTKKPWPLLTSRSMEGEFGTGHNAYVQDDDGRIWNTYHARPGVDAPRSSGVREVFFNTDGEPVLDVIEEKGLNPKLADVKTTLVIKPTYHNPLIHADVPDPDIIRSKDKDGRQAFYMLSTTMSYIPGVPIMKSFDLVHWDIVNYVYNYLETDDRFALKNGKNDYAKGSWAASLRQDPKSGYYFVAFTCNTTQKTYIFMTEDIEKGPWYRNEFTQMCYDNGMLFDDDGRAYIFFSDDCHDGNGTHAIGMCEMFIDTEKKTIKLGEKKICLRNSNYENPKGIGLWGEGFHAYKHNGYYYIFAIQGLGTGKTWQRQEICWRTDSLEKTGRWDDVVPGGWTCKKIFCGYLTDENGNRLVNESGIAQGGIVDTEDGKWYCFIFQDSGSQGRIPCLCEMKWGTEGELKDWPVIGTYLGEDDDVNRNIMPYVNSLPVIATDSLTSFGPEGCAFHDDFNNRAENFRVYDDINGRMAGNGENDYNGSNIDLRWQWNHNPDNRFWSLTEREGFLRIKNIEATKNIRVARNMLTCRSFGPNCTGETCLDLSGMSNGMSAGLTLFQRRFGYIAVTKENGSIYVEMRRAESKQDPDGKICSKINLGSINKIYLRATCDYRYFDGFKDEGFFSYSTDGKEWHRIGEVLYMHYDLDDFVGYRYGLFSFSTTGDVGYTDFEYFDLR